MTNTVNGDEFGLQLSYLNNVICSDLSIYNDSDTGMNFDNEASSLFKIMIVQVDGETYLLIILVKDDNLMTDENYTSDDFKDITFTITGSDS